MEMLHEWLRTEPQNATWARLIESLQTPSVKLNQLANRLQQMLLQKSKHVCTYTQYIASYTIYAFVYHF